MILKHLTTMIKVILALIVAILLIGILNQYGLIHQNWLGYMLYGFAFILPVIIVRRHIVKDRLLKKETGEVTKNKELFVVLSWTLILILVSSILLVVGMNYGL